MRKLIFMSTLLAVALIGIFGVVATADAQDEPKHTIKEVMQQAHRGDGALLRKVLSGNASDEEKAKLNELYTALAANKPPKGDEASWKEKTKAILDAAKAGDAAALRRTTNCRGCHSAHRGQ